MFKSTKVISSVVGFVMLFALISGLLILNKQSVYGKTGSGTYTIIVKANSDGIYGDLNGDKIVDSRDITLLGRYILEIYDFDDKQLKYADLNLDSRVDSIDYNIMRRYLLEIIDTIPIGVCHHQHQPLHLHIRQHKRQRQHQPQHLHRHLYTVLLTDLQKEQQGRRRYYSYRYKCNRA